MSVSMPKMYEESGHFDPNAMMGATTEDCFSQLVSELDPQQLYAVFSGTATATETNISFPENMGFSVENLSYPYSFGVEEAIITDTTHVATAMEIKAHSHQMENPNGNKFSNNLVEVVNNKQSLSQNHSFHPQFGGSPASPYGNSSHSFENNTNTSTTWLQQQPITRAYIMPQPSKNDFVLRVGNDDREGSGIVAYQDGNGALELEHTHDVTNFSNKRKGKMTKQVTNNDPEKKKRVDLNGKYDALKDLIPNPTKNDRASVVGDTIEYIRELLRTVNALKLLAENKRAEKQRRMKRNKVAEGDTESELENSITRSSWIQRKSRDTEVDVHIVDDEVTIKLLQRKKINCLVYVSQILDEFKLVLQHVASGHIGNFSSFFINSKICEGSTAYASAIANKLIEVMDRSLASA